MRHGSDTIQALALALDSADLPPEVHADALFLHRSFRLGDQFPGLGVLASHDGFDAALTTGANLSLARRLGWTHIERLHWQGKVLGLKATPPQRDWNALTRALHSEFGGMEAQIEPASSEVASIALINAMRPDLLTFLAGLGVNACITGQLRPAAVPRARELGLGIAALGHHRSELWGLRQLARELEQQFPELHTRVYGEA
ncbi:Nif3-like dinuclear metal center hexameric protein [Deinococcus sp. KNUC1210]|uniref:Nif3-like dinuclear metal center hexameric protein n=1 Tax=Deinococcus sp. KNUC1210 TaxID=2917691 RepID=UPI001EF074F3|nr:Nif3-like dinuclear metal center hexameric protein [Deinococcus sp. KNUC1210]ULH16713.1 Nif3-like dinuclear metal center hexameric protein [Deinococcus sp. KNUC1210]